MITRPFAGKVKAGPFALTAQLRASYKAAGPQNSCNSSQLRRRLMARRAPRGWVVFIWVAMLPAAAFAQASIAGTVKDTSGAILPGVTVEAASPALIEKA